MLDRNQEYIYIYIRIYAVVGITRSKIIIVFWGGEAYLFPY